MRSSNHRMGYSSRSASTFYPHLFSIHHKGGLGGESLTIFFPDERTIAYTAKLHTFSKPSITLCRGENNSRQRWGSQNSVVGEADFHHIRPIVDIRLPDNQIITLRRGSAFGNLKTKTFRLWGMDFVLKPTSSHGRGSSLQKDVKLVNEMDGTVWAIFHRSGRWRKWGDLEILAQGLSQNEVDALVMVTISYLEKVKRQRNATAASAT